MELRVHELADAAGIGVDTVRFYQSRSLIPKPVRRGRYAIYGNAHLERIRRIRGLLESGFSLAQIRRLLDSSSMGETEAAAESSDSATAAPIKSGKAAAHDAKPLESKSLLEALADQSVGEGTLTRAELADETGVPEALIEASLKAGLLTPLEVRGEARFPRSDMEMLRAALEILGMGLPLDKLIELGARHAREVGELAESAIDLFDDSIRKPLGEDDEAVRRVFERLLPRATQIVALHFQRTVVARALERLRASGDAKALEDALEITQAAQLEVQWR